MRIQLKQNEIEEAITGYLAKQGIAVGGKSVNMLFTSGRKNNGLSVEVLIEDALNVVAVDPAYTSADAYAAEQVETAAATAQETVLEQPEGSVTGSVSLFG